MFAAISERLAELLLSGAEEERTEKEIYVYGIELILSTCLGFTSILVLSGILSELPSALFYMLVFIPLRMFSGGYHAKTYGRCFLLTNGSYLVVLGMKEVLWNNMSTFLMWIILTAASIYIVKRAPVINPLQPIDKTKQEKCRRMVRRCLCLAWIWCLCLSVICREGLCMTVLSICLAAVLMLIADRSSEQKEVKQNDAH